MCVFVYKYITALASRHAIDPRAAAARFAPHSAQRHAAHAPRSLRLDQIRP